ncbi:VWA domain-containing protein, partial [Mesorhizobium sp. M7A.F.Ca.US.002.01.1.1]
VWLNPEDPKNWGYTHSIAMIRDIFGGRMFPLTLAGLEGATKQLSRKH